MAVNMCVENSTDSYLDFSLDLLAQVIIQERMTFTNQ